jgi:hypothetical protein
VPTRGPEIAIAAAGLVVTAVLTGIVLFAIETTSYDVWGGILIAPLLIGLTLPALWRQAEREGDRTVFRFLVLALLVKVVLGTLARYYAAYWIYGGKFNDAGAYHDAGVALANQFRAGDFATGLDSLTGTDFLRLLPGVFYTVTGPTRLGGFFILSWLAFIGLFCFYRAFALAVPEGRARTYGRFLFFLPSLVYWPSSIGKDAWMVFGLGVGALGAAYLFTGRRGRGGALVVTGVLLAGIVRVHMAGILLLAVAIAFVYHSFRRRATRPSLRARVVTIGVLAVAFMVLAPMAQQFLADANIDTTSGLTGALEGLAEQTDEGASTFEPAVLDSPIQAPLAVFTVLFRPAPFEAHNATALVAALEGVFLISVLLVRLRWLGAAIRHAGRRGYVMFAVGFTLLFIVAFSSVSNFGILSRQRVQVLPLFLVLFAIPSAAARRRARERAAEEPASAASVEASAADHVPVGAAGR